MFSTLSLLVMSWNSTRNPDSLFSGIDNNYFSTIIDIPIQLLYLLNNNLSQPMHFPQVTFIRNLCELTHLNHSYQMLFLFLSWSNPLSFLMCQGRMQPSSCFSLLRSNIQMRHSVYTLRGRKNDPGIEQIPLKPCPFLSLGEITFIPTSYASLRKDFCIYEYSNPCQL